MRVSLSSRRPAAIRPQSGFTIIEVLVAVTISLILLIGVIRIFQASKQSYTLQTGVARLQENARYALDIMAHSISLAGLNNSATSNLDPFDLATTADGGGSASDTITVTYAAAEDCLGNATVGGVASDTFSINADSTLRCNGIVIVDGVDNMQILYGQDDTSPGPGNPPDGVADRFLSLPNVTHPSDADADGGITSVRIALLVSTVDQANTVKDTTLYSLLNAPALPAFDDLRIRRVFTRTVLLRNYFNRPNHPLY